MHLPAASARVHLWGYGAWRTAHAAPGVGARRRGRAESARPECQVAGMAKRKVARRGRSWLALALLAFVLIAAGVIWRRTSGIAQARELRQLEERRQQLQAQRTALEGEIRDLSSRSALAPIVEHRLGMHVPSDTQVIILPSHSVAP